MERELNNNIHHRCIIAKEVWINNECAEIENLSKNVGEMMYKKIKQLLKDRIKKKNITIKKDRSVVIEFKEVKRK